MTPALCPCGHLGEHHTRSGWCTLCQFDCTPPPDQAKARRFISRWLDRNG